MSEPAELAGTIALISGAGRGIGKAVAEALATAGATVALLARSSDQLETTASAIREQGGRALTFAADATDRATIQRVVNELEQQLGRIDILVNNAGRHHAVGPLWELDPDDWWQDIESNLRSTFLCAHAVLPGMIQRRSGCIINVSSGAGNEPRPYSSAYSTAKAAVTRLSECLGLSTKEYGVSVFSIHPGAVRTELANYLLHSEAGKRWLPGFAHIYDEQEVPSTLAANLVIHLASGRASKLSGRFLSVQDDLEQLIQRADAIQQQDLLVLRLRKAGLWE